MSSHRKILAIFSFKRIIIPIIIGLLVTAWLIFDDFNEPKHYLTPIGQGEYILNTDEETEAGQDSEYLYVGKGNGNYVLISQKEMFGSIEWKRSAVLWLLLSLVFMVIRDLAYMYRLRVLTDKQLSWRRCLDVVLLWEFASSVTPSVVGGAAVALFIIRKEGINMGRTTAIVMITALLDEVFYILFVPLIILLAGRGMLFPSAEVISLSSALSIETLFVFGYAFILALTLIILLSVFAFPFTFKKVLGGIFHIPFLKRWQSGALQTGDEIIVTSREMKGKPVGFWLKAFGATAASWTSRFLVVNCLILAFSPWGDQFLILGRQLVMWLIMLISPTPGSSGVAEWVFAGFLGDFIAPGMAPFLAFLWRLISYYPYLIIGMFILPYWLRRIYLKRKLIRFKSDKT